MPIKDIKHFIDCCMEGDSTIVERLLVIGKQRDTVVKKMEELQSMLDMLNYKYWYYQTAKKAGTCTIYENMPKEEIPEQFQKFIQ